MGDVTRDSRNADTGVGAEGSGMSDDRRQPMDLNRAERLISGAGDPGDPVARLLAAVRAPAMADELAREDHAVVAFRMSRWSGEATRPLPPVRQRTGWARAFGVKGLAIGLGTAVALEQVLTGSLRGLFYGAQVTQPVLLSAVAIAVAAAALLATWIPARRATKVEPTVALRSE